MKDDGSGRKILVHAAIGGIMSSVTGAGFTSGAVGAGLNEAVIKEIDKVAKHDPGTAQIVSAIIGAAAAKAAGGNAAAGAATAASGTKWNLLLDDHARKVRQEVYQNFSGHGIVNIDHTKHGLPFVEFGSGSLVNETLRKASFNISLVKNAMQNVLGVNCQVKCNTLLKKTS